MKDNTYNAYLYGIGFIATALAEQMWLKCKKDIRELTENIFGILQQAFLDQLINYRAINGEKALWLFFKGKKLLVYFDEKEKMWSWEWFGENSTY